MLTDLANNGYKYVSDRFLFFVFNVLLHSLKHLLSRLLKTYKFASVRLCVDAEIGFVDARTGKWIRGFEGVHRDHNRYGYNTRLELRQRNNKTEVDLRDQLSSEVLWLKRFFLY